ncbi:glycoside hydrolase family 13 protein [Geodermatophilus marinus]|uniref:glycoside hydrolase family 13 protein n=1 Tax=Geodermatophilus sp. LHW52908 TaxID=2303986 RepID=UPI000E3E0F23|nr:glycoside hydrolase family 13 protein [Geodermatophilus sp. LHW52908]RFU22084.1 glycoside hydrolase family 13 protein [Geodermatophilus sp. LHW52908]
MTRRLSTARTAPRPGAAAAPASPWWRDAVVYQVYLRSFADGNGDGIGDLAGLRARLPYLAWLGVDAVWVNPHYPSGGADGGYDVVDHRAVDPDYGDVADVEALVEDARALGLRVLLDVVPNHSSDQHPWFRRALADPTSPEAGRYHFAPPSEAPPNNWRSLFGGPAWSRTPDGRWYLHLFSPEQPDLNWRDPAVAADFEDSLRFWLDRGVSGFRVDVAYGLFKDAALRDNPGSYSPTLFGHGPEQAMTWDQPEVHDVWRRWRAVCDEYPGTMLVGEVCLADLDRVARYSRPDELHQSLAFRLLKSSWDAAAFAEATTGALDAFGRVGAPVSWVLGNHDKDRMVSRFGGGAVGTARARAAALLLLALPGSAYVYAGDELGLPQAHVPEAARQDPIFHRSGGARAGRDGCRVPLPWNTAPGLGFSPAGAADPWLPVPAGWERHAVSRQAGEGGSTLTLYRRALALRKAHPALGSGAAEVSVEDGLLTVRCTGAGGAVRCVVNMGRSTRLVAGPGRVLLASTSRVRSSGSSLALPPDSAVWVTEG